MGNEPNLNIPVPLVNQPAPKLPPQRTYVVNNGYEPERIVAREHIISAHGDILFLDTIQLPTGEYMKVLVDSFAAGQWDRVRESYAHHLASPLSV